MASHGFNFLSFLWRLLFALVIVFASYNPESYSYYHWIIQDLKQLTALKAFVGVVLLIAWVIYIRATTRALGVVGVILAIALFATLFWMLIDEEILPRDNIRVISYVVLITISLIMAIGMSWSHIRRRLTGQIDIDDVDDNN